MKLAISQMKVGGFQSLRDCIYGENDESDISKGSENKESGDDEQVEEDAADSKGRYMEEGSENGGKQNSDNNDSETEDLLGPGTDLSNFFESTETNE